MNMGAFGENFPYSNFHDINMDWIIKIAKDFLDQYTNIQNTISDGLEQLDSKAEELTNLLDQWYNEHSEDIANQLVDAMSELASALNTAITDFNTRAEAKAEETIESIPADYTELFNRVKALEDYRDFLALKGVIIDAYINYAERTIVRNDLLSKTIYIPCLPNTKYIVEKDAGTRFVVACCENKPERDGSTYGTILNYVTDPTGSHLELVTAPNANYLVAWVYHSSDSETIENMLKSVVIYPRETNANLWHNQSSGNFYIDINVKTLQGNQNACSVFVPCKPNTKYLVKKTAGQRFTVASSVDTPATGVNVLTYKYDPNASEIEYITPPNANYLIAWVYLATADTGITADVMLSSVSITEEEPIENLWDGTDVLDVFINVPEKRLIRHDLLAKTIVIPCKPNTIYSAHKTAGVRFAVGVSSEHPAWNGTDYGTLLDVVSDPTANNLSIMTPPGSNFLCVWVWLSTDTTSAIDMLSSVYVYENKLDLIFWGDSITAGIGGDGTTFPKVCADLLNKTHLNCGVGGETSNTIAVRQGGNNIVIPAGNINGNYNDGVLKDIFNHAVSPLRQGVGANSGQTIIIENEVCSLSITQTSPTSTDAVYHINGYTGGASVFPLLARLVGADMEAEVTVIFVGQNGSWVGDTNNLENRVAIIDSMIKHLNNNKYVVVGLVSGTSSREAEETELTKKYGNKYIPSRRELVNYGLAIAGLTPTSQDTTDINNGTVPTSLRYDQFHLNAYGYTALGTLIANKINALGYFD